MKHIFYSISRMGKGGIFTLFCIVLLYTGFCPALAQNGQTMVPPVPVAPSMSLLPYLEYFLDESGEMDEKEVTSPDNIKLFHKFDIKNLPNKTGALWLRFTLAPLPNGTASSAIFLDLGAGVPGMTPLKRKLSPLPTAGKDAQTCLIRLDGIPGPWFSPTLCTPIAAVDNWKSFAHLAATLSLAVVMLLCLLRCLTEKGQWRFWTAIYVGTALLQAFLGLPATVHGRVEMNNALAALTPGLALMMFAHVGRHIAGVNNRALNIQLFLLSLPGAALALLPLWPDFAWITRYTELWPAGTLLFAPSALWAVMTGITGARRFLLGCLVPPIFTIAALFLTGSDIPPGILASSPLWGIALSAMLIVTAASPAEQKFSAVSGGGEVFSPASDADVYNLEEPLGDPNLRLIPVLPESEPAVSSELPVAETAPYSPVVPQNLIEDAVRVPLERLLREGAALEHCALPPAVRQYVESMLSAGREMSDIISNPLKSLQTPSARPKSQFNLQHLMRNVHDSVSPMAKTKGIGLAWYMPPHLEHIYEGEAEELDQTLLMLLESAVRATRHGSVQFSAKRVPESTDSGHLLFTVKDTGSGMPPQNRSSLALTRVWELTGAHNGFLGLECSPQGATIAFTLHLKSCEDAVQKDKQNALPHIIITAESAVDRQLLSHMLKSLPCRSSETRSLHEALLLHRENPSPLIILCGRFADATAPLLQQFTDIALAASLPFCKYLGITHDDNHWDAMAQEGFTHALMEPLDSESFCITVDEILEALLPDNSDKTEHESEHFEQSDTSDDAPVTIPEKVEEASPRYSPQSSPIPNLFTSPLSDVNAQIKIPDLTALPDLLSFAESLRAPISNTVENRNETVASPPINKELLDFASQTPIAPASVPSYFEPITMGAVLDNALTMTNATPKDFPKDVETADKTQPLPNTEAIPTLSRTAPDEQVLPSPEVPQKNADGPIIENSDKKDATPTVSKGGLAAKSSASAAPKALHGSLQLASRSRHAPDKETKTHTDSQEDPRYITVASTEAVKNELSAQQATSLPASAQTPKVTSGLIVKQAMPAPDDTSEERVGKPEPAPSASSAPVSPVQGKLKIKPQFKEKTAVSPEPVQASKTVITPIQTVPTPTAPTPVDMSGEWVGEPTPIHSAPSASTSPAQGKLTIKPQFKEKTVVSPQPAQASKTVIAPIRTVPTPVDMSGEWVGEPTPIHSTPSASTFPAQGKSESKPQFKEKIISTSRPPQQISRTDVEKQDIAVITSAPVQKPIDDAAVPTTQETKGGNSSFMDFIADVSPRTTQQAPETATRPAPGTELAAIPQNRQESDNTMSRLIERLDSAMTDAQKAYKQHQATAVGEAAKRIATESDNFGLRVLARMARCVERAARANDMNALRDLLPELTAAVERNRIALTPRS